MCARRDWLVDSARGVERGRLGNSGSRHHRRDRRAAAVFRAGAIQDRFRLLLLHAQRKDPIQLGKLRVHGVFFLHQSGELLVPGPADFLPLLIGIFADGRAQLRFLTRLALLVLLSGNLLEPSAEGLDTVAQLTGVLGQLARDFAQPRLIIALDARKYRFGSVRALLLQRVEPLLVSLPLF